MDTRKKMLGAIGLGVLVILIIGIGVYVKVFRGDTAVPEEVAPQEVTTGAPVDIALDYFESWLEAARSTSTPYDSGLTAQPFLSPALKTKLEEGRLRDAGEIDPVLCQTTLPERISARVVHESGDVAQVLVLAKGKPEQTVFSMKRQGEGWYIDDIVCSYGESTPPREFTFDREGYLLKSVPPPLDPQYWHIVFEENEERGHYSPLLFSDKSNCVALDGSNGTCAPDTFVEATKVHIAGQMTESGIDVVRLEIVKE